jgi:hypothetical protein
VSVRPKIVAGYVLGWFLIVFFVVLLTLIFSFLGTIICAALAGMMMGAARLPRLQSLLLSVVFPGVLASVLVITRAELPGRQILFLSLLCLGIFWVIYLAISALVAQEKAERDRSQSQSAASPAHLSQGSPMSAVERTARPRAGELTLDALEGKWLAQSSRSPTSNQQKVLEISRESLVLSLTSPSGQVQFCGQARLSLCDGSMVIATGHADSHGQSDTSVCI